MKIVYLYPELSFVGGNDRVIVDKLNYFAEVFQYDVYLVTTQQFGKKPFFELSPKVRHLDMEIDFNKQYKSTFFKRVFIYFGLLYAYKRKLRKLLQTIKPDITITTVSRDLDFIHSIKDGSKKIAEAHLSKKYVRALDEYQGKGLIKGFIGKYLWMKLEDRVKKLDAFVVLTNEDAKNWEKVRRSVVIPNPLPFYPESVSSCDNKKIICVGRFEYQKGFDLLIEAWNMISGRHAGWEIHVYGKGSLAGELSDLIRQKGLHGSFFLEEPVTDIENKYIDSSFFVLSSRFEGFGMVLIEAMSCGLPVISFDCPDGPSDIIQDGEDGFLIQNGNIEELAEKIEYLIEHDALRPIMGRAARTNVQKYSKETVMSEWKKLFDGLVRHKT